MSKFRANNADSAPGCRKAGHWAAGFFLLLLSLLLSGCAAEDDGQPGLPFTGEIVEVLTDQGMLVVDREEFPRSEPAGRLQTHVAQGDLANAAVGQRVRGRLIESEEGYRLERIWPDDPGSRETIEEAGRLLRQETAALGSMSFREVGEQAPKFALFNQDGNVVQVGPSRGSRVALKFIFTRCPDAKMCPAAIQRMLQLQQEAEAREAGIENFDLDPEHDTPGILRQYADSLDIDTSNYSFLTGPKAVIDALMDQMGILVDGDSNTDIIRHTLGTVLIDESGVIRHRAFGSNWLVFDFLERLQELEGGRE